MTQTVYLFDPHGVDAKCLISNESRAVPALGGRFRCIIPSAAPFYRKGVVVKAGARVLKEGTDFYFGHQYVRGTHQTAQMIYGSILILDPTVTGTITITYQTLGGQYTVTDNRITQYLANELTDPTTAVWESVMTSDLYFPPVDIAYNIDNWTGEVALIDAIEHLGEAVAAQDPKNSDEYDLYDRWILEQRKIVDDSKWAEHLADSGSSGGNPTPDTGIVVNYLYSQEWGTFQTIFGQGETPGTAFNWIPDNTGNQSYVEDGGSWRYDSFNNFLFNDISTAYNSATGTPYGDDNTTFNKSYCGVVNRAPSYYTANVHFAPVTDYINDADSAAADYTYGSPGLVSMVLRHRWGFRGEPQQLSVIFSPDGGKRNSLGLYENTVSLWYNYGYSDAVCIAGVRGNLNIPEMSTSFEGIPGFNILVNLQPDVVRITIYVFVTDYHSFTFEVPVPDIEVYYPDITDGSFGIGAYRQPYVYVTDNMLQEDVWEVTTVGTDNTYGFALDPNHDTMGGKISYIGPNYGFAYNYDEPVNYRDMGHWNIEWYDDKPTLVLESLYRIVDSDTIACQSTDDGYTATYSGKLTDNGYTFYQLKTPLSAGSGTFYMWRDFGQPMDIRLVKGIPGVAGIVVKYQPGEQLDLIIDPTNMFNSNNGGLQLWYNFNQVNGHLIAGSGLSGLFKDGYARWDELNGSNPMELTIDFLPDGLHVTLAYGPDHLLKLSLYVPADLMANAVFDYKTFVVESKIGFGGWMQPFIEYAGQWIKEYGYTYNEPSQPTGHGSNPHNTQWYDANALKSDGIAQNADKFNGLTKDQLEDYVNARQGVTTGQLFPLVGNRTLTGDLVLQDGLANLSRYAQDTTGENESFLQLSTGNITLNGDRNVTIQADKDKNTPGAAATLEAGVNVLKVVSSGTALENDKLLFNNQQVLTTETLKDHLPTDANASVNISYVNGGGLTFTGKGSSGDPLKVNVTIPDGDLTKAGLMRLTSALDNSVPEAAATPFAVKTLNDRITGLVPTTRKINGYPLSTNVRLTTKNLGLEFVDNTTDAAKPVNSNHRALLNQYSLILHDHDASDFSMNNATTAVAGLVIYSDVISTDTTHGLLSTAVSMLDTTADENDRYLYTKVPVTATDIVRYGDAGYLPIPVVGSYPAAGVNSASLSTVGEVEADGTLVCLRNGADVVESGVYYTYTTFNTDGSIKKVTPTTTRYAPDYLATNDSMAYVTRGTEGVFVIRSTLGKYYIVLTNGTMESRYHVASEITTSLSHGWQLMPIIVGQYVYLINHNYSNTEYAFSAWRCLRSDIGKGPVAFTQMTFTGTDPFGNVQTAVTRYNLVPGGISTDPAAKVMMIDTSAGTWTGRNLRNATLNYDMVAEGNRVRVMSYISTYFSNAYKAVGVHFPTSYVIDFDTMSATLDNATGFPISIDAAGVHTTTLRLGNENLGFPMANANNATGVIRSRGKTIAHMFYGSEVIPRIAAFKYTVGATAFDQLDSNVGLSALIGSSYFYSGNYGSVLKANPRGIHLLAGNRFIAYQSDDTYALAEYDINSTYAVGDLGYGPTVNRKTITQAQYSAFSRSIYTVDDLGVSANDGFVFSDGILTGQSKVIGETLANNVSITATAFNALKAEFFAQVIAADAGSRFINATMSIYVSTNPIYPVVAVYQYRAYIDDTMTSSALKNRISSVTVDDRTNITSAVCGATIRAGLVANNCTLLAGHDATYGGSSFAQLSDGNVLMILQSNARYGVVGGAGALNLVLMYKPATSTWVRADAFTTNNYAANGYYYTKEQGIFLAWRHATGEAIMINRRGFTHTAFGTGTYTTAIFSASRVASGWLIYFTEPVVYFCDGVKYTLPVQTLDVRTFFPGEYQNQTMYLYVTLIAGVPTYTMSLTKLEDTAYSTYIGYCTTDSNKVTELSVERATRLGLFRELQAHLNDTEAHGAGSVTLSSLGLPLLENKAPHYELKTNLFGEMFNSWYRFSHADGASWAQPGIASELNAWSYNAATDTVQCTQNTASYVGFVSPDSVADYTFETIVGVSASSSDNDDDIISMVLAFKTVGGIEHTLSIIRTGNLAQAAPMRFSTQLGVYYDYFRPDQKTVATVDTSTAGEAPSAWKGKYARMRATRTGNTFVVKSTVIAARDWLDAVEADFVFTMTFTLDDLPELAIFKGPVQYGYGAFSQTTAQYVNVLRPDEDGRNYYATAIEAIKAADWQSRMSLTSGVVVNGGVLPVPAGFDATECRWFLTHREPTGALPAGKGLMSYTMSYNASRVVTATSTYEGGTVVGNSVHYQCLAVKGIKLFK